MTQIETSWCTLPAYVRDKAPDPARAAPHRARRSPRRALVQHVRHESAASAGSKPALWITDTPRHPMDNCLVTLKRSFNPPLTTYQAKTSIWREIWEEKKLLRCIIDVHSGDTSHSTPCPTIFSLITARIGVFCLVGCHRRGEPAF